MRANGVTVCVAAAAAVIVAAVVVGVNNLRSGDGWAGWLSLFPSLS